jgi:hypothetical protein
MERNLLEKNRERSARALTLYPKRLLNTADQAREREGLPRHGLQSSYGFPSRSRYAQKSRRSGSAIRFRGPSSHFILSVIGPTIVTDFFKRELKLVKGSEEE